MKLLQKARDEGRVGGTCPFSYKENVSVQFGHEATAKSHGKVSFFFQLSDQHSFYKLCREDYRVGGTLLGNFMSVYILQPAAWPFVTFATTRQCS